MDQATDAKMPWVIAQLNTRLFALNCAVVREMVIMPEVCEVPGVPDYVRGVINLRGRVTPLVDLRRAWVCAPPMRRSRNCAHSLSSGRRITSAGWENWKLR